MKEMELNHERQQNEWCLWNYLYHKSIFLHTDIHINTNAKGENCELEEETRIIVPNETTKCR